MPCIFRQTQHNPLISIDEIGITTTKMAKIKTDMNVFLYFSFVRFIHSSDRDMAWPWAWASLVGVNYFPLVQREVTISHLANTTPPNQLIDSNMTFSVCGVKVSERCCSAL